MGVLFVMPRWDASSELWMSRMIEALAQDLSYIVAERPGEKFWNGRVPVLDLAPDNLTDKVRKRLGFPTANRGKKLLSKLVRSPQVTSIFIHWLDFAWSYMDVWSQTNKPLFIHCHGYDVTWDLRSQDKLSRERQFPDDYPVRVRLLAERAILIANSHCTARKLTDIGVPSNRIALHYFGVPARKTAPEPASKAEVTVLFLGRLIDFKGPDLVINAFELACDRGLKGRLIIAGDGPLGTMCKLLQLRSRYAQQIELLGTVDAQRGAELRREADIFTAHSCTGQLSNQEEAFGVAFAEAMADGLPVVTGRSGSLEELVENGVTGILFAPGDVEAHADALLELARNSEKRLQMGRAGWERAKTVFSPENDSVNLRRILGLLPGK